MNFSWKEVEVNSGKDSIEVNQLDNIYGKHYSVILVQRFQPFLVGS
jgi:hypothetical protein